MTALLNSLLELVRSDSEKSAFLFETIDLDDFIAEICSDLGILFVEGV
jgi:signal transduction histidine kinase